MFAELYVLKCVQRRAATKQLKEERVRSFEYVLPYVFKPGAQEEEDNTAVNFVATLNNIPYPIDFDWKLDTLDVRKNTIRNRASFFEY